MPYCEVLLRQYAYAAELVRVRVHDFSVCNISTVSDSVVSIIRS